MSPTVEEHAAFNREQLRAMGDLNCSHDQAWLDEALAAERRATVERIRERLERAMQPYGEIDDMFRPEILAILDEELLMRDSEIDTLSANGAQEALQTHHVLMDISRWDTDEGRAWITVEAAGPAEAKQKVRELYPNAAVLTAEADDGR